MRKFTEYCWDRTEREYVEACQAAGLDPKEQLLNELLGLSKLWNRMTGRGQPQEEDPAIAMKKQRSMVGNMSNPKDQGSLLPSTQGTKSFSNNTGYAQLISQEIKNGIPGLLKNVRAKLSQQYPKLSDPNNYEKLQRYFFQVQSKLEKSAADMMAQAKTSVDGEKYGLNDPHMQRMAQGSKPQPMTQNAPTPTPTNGPPPHQGSQEIPTHGLNKPIPSKRGSARVDIGGNTPKPWVQRPGFQSLNQ